MATSSANPFDSLPIETTQHIASFLEYDTDLCNYRLICRSTLDAVDADNCSFWRQRFKACFEDPNWPRSTPNEKYKITYQKRKHLLKNGPAFKDGDRKEERECLEVLRDLIVESFSGKSDQSSLTYESANLTTVQKFLLAHNLLQIIFQHPKPGLYNSGSSSHRRSTTRKTARQTTGFKPTPLLRTIQALCAPMLLSFEPHLENCRTAFPDSQVVAYSTPSQWPIFDGAHGLDVRMDYILHSIDFWRYHMLRVQEGTLFWPFTELDAADRPRWWNSRLVQGGANKIGKNWKGSYAYVERPELDLLRSQNSKLDQNLIQDNFAGEQTSSFQDLQLEFVDANDPDFPWPEAFERHLQSLTPPPSRAKTRAQKRCATPDAIANFKPQSFRFDGEGQDVSEAFLASGWLNPLPPQNGVPGWQRMTMMKYFEDENEPSGIDINALWAYEGVVLPGGQIVLGRWWSVSEVDPDEFYSGPFILWCVDGPEEEMETAT